MTERDFRTPMNVIDVAAQTAAAAHRRDHAHAGEDCCHPHTVEVVHLGDRAVVVCHDCCSDTGFVGSRSATPLAAQHRTATTSGSVILPSPAA